MKTRRTNKRPSRPAPGISRSGAYKGHLITFDPYRKEYYLSKAGRVLGAYKTPAAAKDTVDRLFSPGRADLSTVALLNPRRRTNPRGRPGAFKIYDDIVSIVARKRTAATTGGNPKRRGTYEHKFKTAGTAIFGLPDGSLLIKGDKSLWEKNEESRYEL